MITPDQEIHRDRCLAAMKRYKADDEQADLEIIMDSLVALGIMHVEIVVDEHDDRARARKLYSVKPESRELCRAMFDKGGAP